MTRSRLTLLLVSIAGLIAGCNSRDSLYSQGPWGPPDVRRSYPQYTSPWGGRIAPERPLVISGSGYPLEAVSPAGAAGSWVTPQRLHDDNLPADPQPPAPVVARAHQGTAQPEPALISSEEQRQVPVQVPPAAPSSPGVFTPPRRASSYAGTWKATDGAGRSCLVHLSSVASLDLYKASTSKCSSEALRGINLWRFEETRVTLLSRGAEIARLEGTEASLSGTLSGAGTPLKMLR